MKKLRYGILRGDILYVNYMPPGLILYFGISMLGDCSQTEVKRKDK